MSLNMVSFSDKKKSFLEDENIGRSFLKEQYKNDVRVKVYENAIISIAARVARCDGEVSDSEVGAFKKLFEINDSEYPNLRQYFLSNDTDKDSLEFYINRIMSYFPDDTKFYRKIVSKLFSLSIADGGINSEEIILLKKISTYFGLSRAFFMQKLRLYIVPVSGTPYEILGVSEDDSIHEIKIAYFKAVQACHPDKLAFLESSDDMVILANTRINTLATAYQVIKKQRRLNS